MTNRYTAEETLRYIIKNLIYYLDKFNQVKDLENNQFAYGEKIAYIECLEMLEKWEMADKSGLNIDIEGTYL